MNTELETERLLREIESTRAEMRNRKSTLREEADPVHRFKRSWNQHQLPWIAGAAGLALGLGFLIFRRGKERPYVPPGYVVVTPEPPKSRFGTMLKFALLAAKPVLGILAKQAWEKRKR
jgi:hypothetical protein